MSNRVKLLREEKNLTQNELAEQSGLSLRTIQRMEAGNIPKGFTLKAIAKALAIEPENIVEKTEKNNKIDTAKLINNSALLGLFFPYGNIIFPLILTYKTKDPKNKEIGKNIISVQIILSLILSVSMILSPFLQHLVSSKFPLFIIPLITLICLKLYIIIRNGISLNHNNELYIKLNINFL